MAMFRTVRHWWSEGSGQHTARLFVFEFVVVVAGVLVAQALANWARDREIDRQVTEENSRVEYQIGRTQQYYRVWKVALPCLRARMFTLIAAIDTDQRYPDDYLILPAGLTYNVEPVSLDVARPMRDEYGARRMEDFFYANATAENGKSSSKDLVDQWSKFALLAPRYGKLESADRADLRAAGVQALRDMHRIEVIAASMDSLVKLLRIPPISSAQAHRERDVFPAHSCDEIWRTGSMYRATA